MKAIKTSHLALLAIVAISGCASVQDQSESDVNQAPPALKLAPTATESEPDAAPVAVKTIKKVAKSNVVETPVVDADAMMASLAETNDVAEDSDTEVSPATPATSQTKRIRTSVKDAVPAQKPQAKAAPAVKVDVAKNSVATADIAKVEKKRKEKAVASTASKRQLSTKPLKGSKSDLPISHGIWKVMQSDTSDDASIVISTPTWEMGEDGYMSQIWLTLSESKLIVNSSSDIDPNASGSGIRINGGDLIAFSRIEGKNTGVIEGEWLDVFALGGEMDIFMGFFPDRQQRSGTYKSDVVLDDLSRVVPTYRRLNQ